MIRVFENTGKDNKVFWSLAGWFFASREVEKEIGAPIHNDSGMVWIVAEIDGHCVGLAALQIKKTTGHLKHAYVCPEWRGQGIYKQLLKARMEYMIDKGITEIISTCNDNSLPILLKYGFEEIGKRGRYTLVRYGWQGSFNG